MSILDSFFGKKSLQRFFERLHSVSLRGLNYGRASDYEHNGERWLIDDLRHKISSSSAVIFDVGANRGMFAKRVIQSWQGLNYQLHVFEPSARTFEMLRKELPELPFVHLVNQGLGATQGTAELYFDQVGSGLASVYPRDLAHRQIDFSSHETIQLSTLDSYCQLHKIERIDFLKMDVEGHELAVLHGGKSLFDSGRVDLVQFEFGGCNVDSRTFFRDFYNFFKRDFDLFRVISDGLTPLKSYSENLEVYQSANYVAIRKR